MAHTVSIWLLISSVLSENTSITALIGNTLIVDQTNQIMDVILYDIASVTFVHTTYITNILNNELLSIITPRTSPSNIFIF